MLSFVKNYAQNINCKVIAPESLGYVRSTIDPLLNDSIANSHIDILGTHLYGTPINNYYYPLAYEKGKEIWMTEHLWGSEKPEDNTWELALDIAEEINTCMDAQMSAFVYWYIRRFYGLINDDGNITDKGYVMSQFSKFIRPGFHRIDTDFKPVSGVTTTAYKSDSSLVVVVVNTNSNSVDLNLVLTNNNLPFESLTKFTSSENKKMNNDGTQELSGENIAITVDGKSISTFTSNPTGGGKYGNELPIAYLGENINIEIFDSLGTGQVEYSLKGSESTDTDGEIVKYSWAKNGEQFSTQADLDLVLEIGSHTYVLTITDNDGATATSTIVIDVINNNSEEVWMEAECTLVGDNWDIIEDDETSNQKYLTVKAGIEAVDQASTDPNALLTYQFSITEAGNFKVWARVLAPSYSDDSFWIKLDDGEWVMWNGLAENSGWAWNDVNDADGVPLIYPLEVGEHSLLFCFREDGAAIDKFYLTNTGQVPSAFGDDASNCIDNIDNGINSKLINQTITVFPNPVKSNFCIESNEPIELLIITDINGRQILKKAYTTVIYSDEIEIKVDDGIYMLQIVNDSHTVVTKVLVEN
jgi:hypothetical protein